MTTTDNIREGSIVSYDDGRGRGLGTVLEVDRWGMHVVFDDRASSNYVRFEDRAWMDHLTVEGEQS